MLYAEHMGAEPVLSSMCHTLLLHQLGAPGATEDFVRTQSNHPDSAARASEIIKSAGALGIPSEAVRRAWRTGHADSCRRRRQCFITPTLLTSGWAGTTERLLLLFTASIFNKKTGLEMTKLRAESKEVRGRPVPPPGRPAGWLARALTAHCRRTGCAVHDGRPGRRP